MEQKALIIGEETVKKYLSAEDVIDICEKTWRWYGEGKVVMPNKITTDMSALGVAGWFNSMPAYIAPLDTAGLKLVGGYDNNKALGLPYIKANVILTDPRTGILKALVSGDYINDMRTGAQPAIMTKLLAASTDVVCFIGTGLMAYYSLLCMSKTVDIKEVRLCDISEEAKDRFISRFPNAPFRSWERKIQSFALERIDTIRFSAAVDLAELRKQRFKPVRHNPMNFTVDIIARNSKQLITNISAHQQCAPAKHMHTLSDFYNQILLIHMLSSSP